MHHQFLNFRQLQHLLILADELHFGRAAERAHLSQSAFSRSIQSLESRIGLTLFDRDLRNVRPTGSGAVFIQRARRLLTNSSDLEREMEMLRNGDIGHVTMGAGPFSGITVVSSAVSWLQKTHPGTNVRLIVEQGPKLLKQLEEESIDFFVAETRELLPKADRHIERLGSMKGGFYCRQNHPYAQGALLSLDELGACRFASVHMPHRMKHALDEMFLIRTGKDFNLSVESENFAVLKEVALGSDVILVTFAEAIRREIDGVFCVACTSRRWMTVQMARHCGQK